MQFVENGAGCSNASRYTTEVSRGRSSEKGDGGSTGEGPKKQTRQWAIVLEVHGACVKREVSHGA